MTDICEHVSECLMSTYTGESFKRFEMFYSEVRLYVFMCEGTSSGSFPCFKPNHLMPGSTREYFLTSWVAGEGQTWTKRFTVFVLGKENDN